jgi:large repetitive protein
VRTRRQTFVAVICWLPVTLGWLLGVVFIYLQLQQALASRQTSKLRRVASAELFDPATRRWLATGPMTATHYRHDAYAVEGGALLLSPALFETPLAERFDAKRAAFNATKGTLPRKSSPARLAGGKLLFPLSMKRGAAAVFDFASSTSNVTAPYALGRCHNEAEALTADSHASPEDSAARRANACLGGEGDASAIALSGGKVLALSGADAQVYDTAANTWLEIAAPLTRRMGPILRRLGNGKVLTFGGYAMGLGAEPLADTHSTELYDPDTGTWQTLSPTHGFVSELASDTLPGDRIFAIGSEGAELFQNGEWQRLPGVVRDRCEPQACAFLQSGELLVLGGSSETGVPQPLQLLTPNTPIWQSGAAPSVQRAYSAAVTLTNGQVLLSGGEETVPLSWLERWQDAVTVLLAGLAWLATGAAAARLPPARFRPPLLGLTIVVATLALLGLAGYLWLMWAMRGAFHD